MHKFTAHAGGGPHRQRIRLGLGLSTATNTALAGRVHPAPRRSRRWPPTTTAHASLSRAWGFPRVLFFTNPSRGSAEAAAAAAEMEGEEIGLVLARASDLRTRISACAAAAAGAPCPRRDDEEAAKRLDAAEGDEEGAEEEEDEEEEVGSLVGISDALESLERQLAALQVCGLSNHPVLAFTDFFIVARGRFVSAFSAWIWKLIYFDHELMLPKQGIVIRAY
jgi:hypothetical protein